MRGRGRRELALLLEIAARVDLDHVDLAGLREPQVDAAVVAYAQRAIRIDRRLCSLALSSGSIDAMTAFVPWKRSLFSSNFALLIHDLEAAFLEAPRIHLDRRERDERRRCRCTPDVELAALDVFLGERRVAERLLDVQHALHHLLRVAHERFLVDADRRVHAQRLHEQRHAQVAAGLEVRRPAGNVAKSG